MDDSRVLSRELAAEYASWFKALSHATRIQLVGLLATARRPMSVGDIVAELDVGQSTVSEHLRILAEVGFVLVERQGTASYYRINTHCVESFPTAADVVMGNPTPPGMRGGDR